MKPKQLILLFVLLSSIACNNGGQKDNTTDTISNNDTTIIKEPEDTTNGGGVKQPGKVYSNERFKDVTVEQIGEHKFRLKGKAQVFEAAFSWVVEDGHNELKEGHEMTDAGAPEFGNFSFEVDVVKQRKNSTLTIILYEASAKDGSRQHQLPIPLY